MQFGPAIPHNPHGYTAKDGTHYPAVFPYDGVMVAEVMFRDGTWDVFGKPKFFDWGHSYEYKCSDIIAYRLPADHHAYGPKVSRMGREPDYVFNVYNRQKDAKGMRNRIGIWRIYLKDKAA